MALYWWDHKFFKELFKNKYSVAKTKMSPYLFGYSKGYNPVDITPLLKNNGILVKINTELIAVQWHFAGGISGFSKNYSNKII